MIHATPRARVADGVYGGAGNDWLNGDAEDLDELHWGDGDDQLWGDDPVTLLSVGPLA